MVVDVRAVGLVLGAVTVLLAWMYYRQPAVKPHVLYSSLEGLTKLPSTWLQRVEYLPQGLLWIASALLTIAFLDPCSEEALVTVEGGQEAERRDRKPPPTEGAAVYLILDQSGSMEEKLALRSAWASGGGISKLDLMKKVARSFIEGRPKDLIGMVSFARTAQVLSPLTIDHQALLKRLARLDIMRIKDQDGTGIGYAIFKTSNLIVATRHFAEERLKEGKPVYAIKNATIILITDGLQDTNPLDAESRWRTIGVSEAAKYAAANGIHVYVINVDPSLAQEKYALQRHEIQKGTQITGGKFFLAEKPENLTTIYREIESLEKNVLAVNRGVEDLAEDAGISTVPLVKVSQATPWILAALFCVTLSLLLETLWIRQVP